MTGEDAYERRKNEFDAQGRAALSALKERATLCEKEPVGWLYQAPCGLSDGDMHTILYPGKPTGVETPPLYKAATCKDGLQVGEGHRAIAGREE